MELGDLLKAPGKFDGKSVKITGRSGEPRYQESRGKPFTVFDLSDNMGQTVRVFTWGHWQIHHGESVRVEGIFHKTKQVGRHSIKNEIEATQLNQAPESY